MVMFALTGTVVTVTVAEITPAGIVTLAGTAAMEGAELLRATTIPPVGARPVSFTVAMVYIHQ